MTRGSISLVRSLGAVAVLALSGLSASAQSPAPRLDRCIDHDASWTAFDDHRILARSVGRTVLVITDSCPRLGDPLTHIIVTAPGGTPICGPHDVRLYISGGSSGIQTPCSIQSINPLSSDEVRALEASKP